MSDDNEALEDRLTDYFRRVTDTPLPVGNAVDLFYQKNKLTAADVRVVITKGVKSNLLAMVEENRGLRAEVQRLKGARGLTWREFVALCATKIDVRNKTWRQTLASHFGYTVNGFAEWEREDRVPYMMVKKIEDLPDLRGEPVTRQHVSRAVRALVQNLQKAQVRPSNISSWLLTLHEAADTETLSKLIEEVLAEGSANQQQSERSRVPWTPEDYQTALRMLIEEGQPGPQVAAHFGLNEGPIWNKFKNSEPDEALLGRTIEIKRDGAMDVLELWKLGHSLYGAGWRKRIEQRFKLGGRKILFDPPDQVLTPEQIQALREEWHANQKSMARYEEFERLALQCDRAVKIGWMKVFTQMREHGVGLTNDAGPIYAARFNAEHYELFNIHKKSQAKYHPQL